MHYTQRDLDAAVERLNKLADQMELVVARRMRLIEDARLPEPDSFQSQVDKRRKEMLGGGQ
jgi:hypothetical protein